MEYGLREVDYRENMNDNGLVSISVSYNSHLKKKTLFLLFLFKNIKLNENLCLICENCENKKWILNESQTKYKMYL